MDDFSKEEVEFLLSLIRRATNIQGGEIFIAASVADKLIKAHGKK